MYKMVQMFVCAAQRDSQRCRRAGRDSAAHDSRQRLLDLALCFCVRAVVEEYEEDVLVLGHHQELAFKGDLFRQVPDKWQEKQGVSQCSIFRRRIAAN